MLFNDLSDLRDRACLIQNACFNNKNNLQNYSDDKIQQIQSFVSLVDEIEVVLQTLTALHTSGYPVMKQYPTSKRKFACITGKYDELNTFKLDLETQLIEWEKQLCTEYKTCINLTYLSNQQISMIEDAIQERTLTESDSFIYHLLKFMNIEPASIQSNLFPGRSENSLNLLKNSVPVLRNQHDIRSFPLQEDEKINKKILLIETTDNGVLRAILSLFDLNSNSSPIANQLFYCTKRTTWVEVRAFIYRCFYSQILHQLIRPELLTVVIQDQFVQLLNDLIVQGPKHFFRLGIITNVTSSNLYLINGMKKQQAIRIIYDQDLLNEDAFKDTIRQFIDNRCMLIESRIAGLGKSTYIQNKIQQSGRTQIRFPISGDMSTDTLMQRLRDKKIQSSPSSIALHINIGPIEDIQQLNEFLYSLIIFRCFRFGQTPIDVPNEIPIYIELDSSLHLSNLKNEIVILKYLETNYIERLEWTKLNITSREINLVVSYLKAFKDGVINDRNIEEETITMLDQSTSVDLLEKYFIAKKNYEFISWTQFSILLSIYYNLFSSLSKCAFFMVESLMDSPLESSTLRSDLLQSLIDSSDQFTSLGVERIRQNQRAVNNDGNINSLSELIIRWDKLPTFMLIFTDAYYPIFVYKTENDVPLSLKKALFSHCRNVRTYQKITVEEVKPQGFFSRFHKSTLVQRVTQVCPSKEIVEQRLNEYLVDPNQMTHEQFFYKLTSLSTKYFLQQPICEICFTQYEDKREHCIKCSISNSVRIHNPLDYPDIRNFQKMMAAKLESQYVFTADNYVKMLLIYLRIQSNVPVLIMGETGTMVINFDL